MAVLPAAVRRLLFSQPQEFPVFHLLLRVLFGVVTGTGLYLGLFHQLPLPFKWQVAVGGIFVGLCVLATSSSTCRCAVLLMFPSMLGSRGRAYLMVLTLSVLCTGPVANIQANVEAAVLSLGCNLDQQVQHSSYPFVRHTTIKPVVEITQALVDNEAEFQSEALNISKNFQNIRHEVVLQYGYERFTPKEPTAANSTQEQFRIKTMMQCDTLVTEGVDRCADWFNMKWEECTKTIPVPVINHILFFTSNVGLQGRCGLLPLRRSEKKKIIDLQSLKIHTAELHQVTSGVLQVLSISLLSVSLLVVDCALFNVLDIISRHSLTHFNLSSHHQVNINVGGDSMMARLLRKTVSAFNSSSSITINTDNLECVSPPSSLSAGVYVKCVCCVLMAVLFSCLQVYTNRLRRVIAAFYFPEREKKRIVFLYNLMMQSRKPCTDRERVISRGRRIRTVFQQLSRWWHHLSGHQKQEVELEETWYDPG
ncbi:LOW QUALITY PROTEIN: E3 ubiquitin-protein ligase DCST1 [Takifugu flavidus]|uniref:LOW QUALITY PROTEIN: E3 ubiquitin-protein ligase DCST1 n=1 Tax=Takifugu flavidus TaxID=433684 RepID=UPI002544D0FC|nr:LOW QUALITY PROTEIN: E3 ubiquitin-protein ligase DCST1 [Takifugu flavidus]